MAAPSSTSLRVARWGRVRTAHRSTELRRRASSGSPRRSRTGLDTRRQGQLRGTPLDRTRPCARRVRGALAVRTGRGRRPRDPDVVAHEVVRLIEDDESAGRIVAIRADREKFLWNRRPWIPTRTDPISSVPDTGSAADTTGPRAESVGLTTSKPTPSTSAPRGTTRCLMIELGGGLMGPDPEERH